MHVNSRGPTPAAQLGRALLTHHRHAGRHATGPGEHDAIRPDRDEAKCIRAPALSVARNEELFPIYAIVNTGKFAFDSVYSQFHSI